MKRCPTCNRVESDQALKFRRFDGVTLKHAIELDPNSTVAHFRYGLYPGLDIYSTSRLAARGRALQGFAETDESAGMLFDSLRADPRFGELLKHVGLTP